MKAKITLASVAAALLAIVIVGCATGPAGEPSIGSIFPEGGFLPKFLFVVGDFNVAAWKIDANTGAVTPVAGSPFGAMFCPDEPNTDPAGKFLFVPDECNASIWVFSINQSTGALTAVPGSPFPTSTDCGVQAVVDPSSRFLYLPQDSCGVVDGFKLDANGNPTPITGSPFAALNTDQGVAIHPSGKFLYVGTQAGPILAYSIDATSGALTPLAGSPFAAGDATKVLAIPASGDFLFVSDPEPTASEGVWVFKINTSTGALTLVAGSPFSTGTVDSNAQGVAVTPNGMFVFVANNAEFDSCINGDVAAFSVNASTGALTPVPGSPFTAGPNPKRIAVDPSGKFVYVTIEDAGEIAPNAGVLCDPAFTTPGAGGLYVFSVNQGTGALTQVPGSPFTTNVGPEGLTITHQ